MKTSSLLPVIVLFGLLAPSLLVADVMEDQKIRDAIAVVEDFKSMPEHQIPRHVLRDAKGLVVIKMSAAGAMSAEMRGEGVMIARHGRDWCGPAFMATQGWKNVASPSTEPVTELIFVLNTDEAVRAFTRDPQVRLGGLLSVAAGPMGLNSVLSAPAAVFAYSRSGKTFAAVSAEGAMIVTDKAANERFYQRPVPVATILAGRAGVPDGRSQLFAGLF